VTPFPLRTLSHIADKIRVCPLPRRTKHSRREEPVIFARNFSREMLEGRQIELLGDAAMRSRMATGWHIEKSR
jgi:hypothetical protein